MIEFARPFWLLLLPLVGLYWWWLGGSTSGPSAQVSAGRRRLSAALRLLIFSLLVLVLAGLRQRLPSQEQVVTFLLDQSLSTRRQQSFMQDYLEQAWRARPTRTRVSVVHFAGEAVMELPPTHQPYVPRSSQPLLREESNLAGAIQMAAASHPPGESGRLVLLSDGRQTLGDFVQAARALNASGLELDTVALPAVQEPEVLIEELRCPARVKLRAPFELVATLYSTVPVQNAGLQLTRQGKPVGQFKVDLQAGRNVFLLPQTSEEPGIQRFGLQLSVREDGERANNQAEGLTLVEGSQRLAILVPAGASAPWAAPLRQQGLEVDVFQPGEWPQEVGEWLSYQSIVLDNLASTDLNTRTLETLALLVRDAGMGLAMIGGPDSFAAGGYHQTPLAEALPLDLRVRRHRITPPTVQIHVIDKSGSMSETTRGVEHMALAREASIGSLEILTAEDLFGVIGFDDSAKWVVNLQKVTNPKALAGLIASLRAGGGTDLFPALQLAVKAAKDSPLSSRHILILSDGATAPANFEALMEEARRANVYVSTVAVGDGADIQFLHHLAQQGKGRAYVADSAHALPRIFARETMLAARAAFDERPALVTPLESHPILQGFEAGGRPLLGHNLSVPRGAPHRVLLETSSHDPVLAIGRYGLGKCLAFTGDSGLRWSKHWTSDPGFGQLLLQGLRWTMPQNPGGALEASARLDSAQRLVIEARISPELAPEGLIGSLIGNDGISRPLEWVQLAPDRYQMQSETAGSGQSVLSLSTPDGQFRLTQPLHLRRSQELSGVEVQERLLRQAAREGGGRFQPTPEQVFRAPQRPVGQFRELQQPLLALAILLLLLEVAVRRLPTPRWTRSETPSAGENLPASLVQVRARLKKPTRPARSLPVVEETRPQPSPVEPVAPPESSPSDTLEKLRKARRRGRNQD